MHDDKPIDFSDLEEPKDFLEAAAAFAAKPEAQRTITCPACRGTGEFVSKYTGRVVGDCHACKGTGTVNPAAFKRRQTWIANERNGTHAAKERAKEADKAARIAAFREQFPSECAWVDANAPHNRFAASLLENLNGWASLTDRQLTAVRSGIARDAERAEAIERAANTNPRNQSGLDLSGLPAGMYAVPGSDSRLKVRVSRPVPPSKWAGWIFVDDGAAYGHARKYGRQSPTGRYTGGIETELTAICKDPRAAMAAYGHLTGKCGICGRHLEDAESIARGIGPVCYSKNFGE